MSGNSSRKQLKKECFTDSIERHAPINHKYDF